MSTIIEQWIIWNRISMNYVQFVNKPYTDIIWCKECNVKWFKQDFSNWTSGNESIDNSFSRNLTKRLQQISSFRMDSL